LRGYEASGIPGNCINYMMGSGIWDTGKINDDFFLRKKPIT